VDEPEDRLGSDSEEQTDEEHVVVDNFVCNCHLELLDAVGHIDAFVGWSRIAAALEVDIHAYSALDWD
jgi:hypothetical protein